jgi:hypothetical protein
MAATQEKKIIRYMKWVTGDIDSVDGSLDMNTMSVNACSDTIKIAGVTISGRIPNIFTFKHYDKTYCTSECSVCYAGKTLPVSLPTAYMTAEEIGEYISHGYDDLWINPEDPGIVIKFDCTTGHTLITLDNTKVKAGYVGNIFIDFSISQLGELLGFSRETSKVEVGPYMKRTFRSPVPARINWLGDTFDIIINGLPVDDIECNKSCPTNLFGVITVIKSKLSDSVGHAHNFTHVINSSRSSSQLTFQFMSHAQPTLPLLLMNGHICVDLVVDRQ